MTTQEAISFLKQAISEIESTQPMQNATVFDKAIETLEGKDNNVSAKWISVKDRLPEVDKSVIVFARGKNNPIYKIAIASMSNKNVFDVRLETELYWREPWQFFNTNYEITHWMPLPEPPEERQWQMNNWRDDKVTDKQLEYILEMREHSEYPLPEFTGTTKGEAADYINKWTKLAHESRWAIEHGY